MFIPHSRTRTIKMIHFLHLCGFYFLTFIWLFVIRLQPVFGRFDNRPVNLSYGAQQSKKTVLCLNACLCVPASHHASGKAVRCGINIRIPPEMADPYMIGNERLMRRGVMLGTKKRDRRAARGQDQREQFRF